MATRQLQLLRSNTIYESFSAAKTGIEGIQNPLDGSIVLGRYHSGSTYESAIGVYYAAQNKWTVFKSSTEIDAAIQALQNELDATQTGAGLGTGGAYTAPTEGNAGYDVIGGATSLNDAINTIAKAIEDMDHSFNWENPEETATDADYIDDKSKVVSAIKQTDGDVDAQLMASKDLLLTGYTNDGTTNTGSIVAADTIEKAFNKLENATSTGVQISGKTGNQIQRITGDSTAANNGLYSHVEIAQLDSSEITALNDPNVREAYKLVADATNNRTAIGNVIKIYKDSALDNVYLGHVDDALTGADAQGQSATNTIASGTGAEALCFVYHLENGNYKLEAVNVESFLQESEFKDGLELDTTNHTVQVKAGNGLGFASTADADGNKKLEVKIYSTNDTNNYLSVDANGVALNGNAIDEKIANAKTTITEVAAQSPAETTADGTDFIKVVKTAGSGSTADSYAVSTQGIKDYVASQLSNTGISAAGDSVYIDAAVDASNNKKINVTGTYGAFNTPTSADNTLSATDNGIAKAEDVATAVNTVIGNLDGSATATAEANNQYSVLTSVTEVDGVINKGAEVTLAAVAKTGAAADVSYSDTNSQMGTEQAPVANVQAAIEKLDSRIDALGTDALEQVTSANAGIAVGTKSNHSQELTLTLDDSTAGTGSETTGEGAHNALTITSDGLFLSTIWDCGTF